MRYCVYYNVPDSCDDISGTFSIHEAAEVAKIVCDKMNADEQECIADGFFYSVQEYK